MAGNMKSAIQLPALSNSQSMVSDKTAIGKLLKKKFERIGCPHTDNADETWLAELVFQRGESRMRILHWLFSKFHRKLYDMLDPTYQSSKPESRVQRLLHVASSLGLCRPDDINLIQGNTSASKQLAFIDQLLDLVIIMDSSEDPEKHVLRSPGKVNEATHLAEQYVQDCRLADMYCAQGYYSELEDLQASMLPLDIAKMVEKAQQAKLAESTHFCPEPDKLAQMAAYLAEDVARQSNCLRQMELKHHVEVADSQLQQKVTRMLKLVMSELQQMITTFSYTYQNDIEPWCSKNPPRSTVLGAKFKYVHGMAESLTSLLERLHIIRSSFAQVSQITATARRQQALQDKQHDEKLTPFQEWSTVLEDSIARPLRIYGY